MSSVQRPFAILYGGLIPLGRALEAIFGQQHTLRGTLRRCQGAEHRLVDDLALYDIHVRVTWQPGRLSRLYGLISLSVWGHISELGIQNPDHLRWNLTYPFVLYR